MALPGTRPHYHLKTIQRRHFDALARRIGLIGASAMIDDVLAKAPHVVKSMQRGLPRGFPQPLLERVLSGIERHATQLAAAD